MTHSPTTTTQRSATDKKKVGQSSNFSTHFDKRSSKKKVGQSSNFSTHFDKRSSISHFDERSAGTHGVERNLRNTAEVHEHVR